MGKILNILLQKKEATRDKIEINNGLIETKLNELKLLKESDLSLQEQNKNIELEIKSCRDYVANEISGLNEKYPMFSFESPNKDMVVVKHNGVTIDGYIYNKEAEEWEYNDDLPYSPLDTKTRNQYFKNIESIYEVIAKF